MIKYLAGALVALFIFAHWQSVKIDNLRTDLAEATARANQNGSALESLVAGSADTVASLREANADCVAAVGSERIRQTVLEQEVKQNEKEIQHLRQKLAESGDACVSSPIPDSLLD